MGGGAHPDIHLRPGYGPMSLGMPSGPALIRFDELCKVVADRGRGLTLTQLGDAAALAEEEDR